MRINPSKTGVLDERRQSRRIWIYGLVSVSVVLLVWFLFFRQNNKEECIWLTKAEFQKELKGTLVIRAKRKLHFLSPVLWEQLFKNETQFKIQECTILSHQPGNIIEQLGPPMSASSNGTQLWMLSPEDYDRLTPNLQPGTRFPIDGYIHPGMTYLGKYTQYQPRISGNSIELVLNFFPMPSLPEACCRMRIRNGETVVIGYRNAGGTNQTMDLLILNPRLVDGTGKLLNP